MIGLAIIFGLVIGSFLNVVIARLNTGMGFSGRSMCFACGRTLVWSELIPILSFLWGRGKCRSCGSRISREYLIVECVSAFIFGLAAWQFSTSLFSVLIVISLSLLLVVATYDLRHKIIPDKIVYLFIILSLALNLLTFGIDFDSPNFLIGPILFAFFAFFWLISRGRWMGFGDAKLALGLGWMLGLAGGILAMLVAFWVGAICGLLLLLHGRGSITIKHEIPFAPYLVLGGMVATFIPFNILSFLIFKL